MIDVRSFVPVLLISSAFLLIGCSKNSQESYKSKIERFEKEYAEEQADKGLEQALSLVDASNIPETGVITHTNSPIPIIYKKNYEELGFDTSKMTFTTPDWYINQQDYISKNTNNPPLDENTNHSGHEH